VEGVFRAMESLSSFPRRCGHAPEDEHLRIGLRQLIHGQYRILFTIDEWRRVVNVPHIRHGARQAASSEDVTDKTS